MYKWYTPTHSSHKPDGPHLTIVSHVHQTMPTYQNRYRGFLLLAAPFFLTQMSEVVYQFIVLYTKKRLHWCVCDRIYMCVCV